MKRLKGLAMFSFILGLVMLFVGLVLMYILPEFVVALLNNTGVFTNSTSIANAQSKVEQARGLGFAVVIFSLLWMMISVISGGGKKQ